METKLLPVGILYFLSSFVLKVKASDEGLGRDYGLTLVIKRSTTSKKQKESNMSLESSMLSNKKSSTKLGSRQEELKLRFGDKISWLSLEKGLSQAKSSNMPLMLIVHKSWCGACKSLKPKFASSKEIAKLSEQFVMVNVEDDEEPKNKDYAPDGGYIPRILFLNPDGSVKHDFYNSQGNPDYKYFYGDPDHIVNTMRQVLSSHTSAAKLPVMDEL